MKQASISGLCKLQTFCALCRIFKYSSCFPYTAYCCWQGLLSCHWIERTAGQWSSSLAKRLVVAMGPPVHLCQIQESKLSSVVDMVIFLPLLTTCTSSFCSYPPKVMLREKLFKQHNEKKSHSDDLGQFEAIKKHLLDGCYATPTLSKSLRSKQR